MQITITNKSDSNINNFVYGYLRLHIYDLFLKSVNRSRLKEFDELFKINSFHILQVAMSNLLITKNGNYEYSIKINKTIKIYGDYITSWINIITYGNREIKGYTILIDIFKYVSDNIVTLYEGWLNGD